ncbi:hypothetical protein ENSA5_65320 [Enhygromyxa salina]|uniref:Gamma-glutamylcyclotransferase AIG2-like domain-containing protein n=1 Tax=Enhygromyxa salina TaxID=215803 RepID=A0A2S9XBV4_9BACT|nr:gamma-glutamylcyclotransferase family protein [Enhygromyxa salina]PRP90335.1 hypothetical protein ENSA5_65320 [Enhygromyxa salina]
MPRVFVYGAQMAHPESVGAAWPARIADHAVRFVVRGVPLFEPAFAGLEPAPGETALGVIIDFSDETWAKLVRFERGYEVVELDAELLDPDHAAEIHSRGATVTCFAFRLDPRQRTATPRRPSARYARKLAAGARAHGLPPELIARYERAVSEGGRASLALAWLFPLASRIGLVSTTALVGLLLAGLAFALVHLLG